MRRVRMAAITVGILAVLGAAMTCSAKDQDYEKQLRSLLGPANTGGGAAKGAAKPERLAALTEMAANNVVPLPLRKEAADAGVGLAKTLSKPEQAAALLAVYEQLVNETQPSAPSRDYLKLAQRSAELGDMDRVRKCAAILASRRPEDDKALIWRDLAKWGNVLCSIGDVDRGLDMYQIALERAGVAESNVKEHWEACRDAITAAMQVGSRKRALDFVMTAVQTCGSQTDAVAGRDVVKRLLADGKHDDAVYFSRLRCNLIGSRSSAQDALADVVDGLVGAGQMQEALGEAVRHYAVCEIRSLDAAIGMVSRSLEAAHTNDLGTAMRYLEFQQVGPAGRDGLAGTADDLVNPAGEVRPPVCAELDPLKLAAKSFDLTDCCHRALAYAMLGDTEHALGATRCEYGLASHKELTSAAYDVASALKALDGHTKRANQYLVFQRYGETGSDGKKGTADDVKDPLAGVPIAVETQCVAAADREIASCRQTYDDLRRRARLQIATGRPQEGLESMRHAYRVRPISLDALSGAISDVAMAVRAVDGNVFRANRYLLFIKYGPNGMDGKPGTADDLTNPLQDGQPEQLSGSAAAADR